jgi:hypothetical protein
MRRIVAGCEMLPIKPGVDLRGRQISVAQQFLHGTQILARFQQMACKGVAQTMRVKVLGQTTRNRQLR